MANDNFLISKTEMAEILVPANSTVSRFFFHNLPNLRDKKLMALQTYEVTDLTVAASQTALIPLAVSDNAYVTLVTNQNVEIVQNMPYREFATTFTAAAGTGNRLFHKFRGHKIVWEKSFVTIGTPAAIPGVDTVFLFNIYYLA